MTITALALDLDGTLIDSIPEVRAAINALLAEDGLRSVSREETVQFVSDGAKAMLIKAYRAVGADLSDADLPQAIDRYLKHYLSANGRNTEIYPGVVTALAALAAKGVPVGVCTNKPKRSTLAVLEALGLSGYFRAVICPEDVVHCKPDRQHVLETLAAMGVGVDGAALVGDSETDMAAARAAGIGAIAVTYGYPKHGVDNLDADRKIDRFDQILEMIA